MKIAVSVPDELFARADALAEQLGVSRSQVYAHALAAYLEQRGEGTDPVTAKLDELADDLDPGFGALTARGLIDAGQWDW